jgi:ferric-dicitrate binding protein FerR (iron transport regulator)
MVGRRGVVLAALLTVGAVAQAQDPAPQPNDAQVTTVADTPAPPPPRTGRLTYVSEGVVMVAAADNTSSVPAVQNMPLTEGMRLTSTQNGQAEVEFEDGSLVRMTPNSAIRLDTLAIDPNGKPSTVVRVLGGLVYTEIRSSTAGTFRVQAGFDVFWPLENATVRVNMDDPPAVLSVLDGKIKVQHVAILPGAEDKNAQSISGYLANVRAGESLRSDVSDGTRYFLSDRIPPETWDNWNEGRDQAALDQLAQATAVRDNYAGNEGYGWADLDANGTWYNQPDGTQLWQPADALQVGFDPYGPGSWSYVAGAGYSWASGYRWGWTPYRCGRWGWYDGFGWGWQPDSFCRTRWGYRGHYGAYIAQAPKGYVPPMKPIKHPGPVHPIIVRGPFEGKHPPYEGLRGPRRDPGERQIAGVILKQIPASGHPYTSRGGSAVGSALKRDYAVDEKTKAADVGTVSTPVPVTTFVSGPGWHTVSTRPEPSSGGGGFRGLFHSGKPGETPVVMDHRGNPVVPEVRREQNRQAEFRNEQQRNNPGQPGVGNQNSSPARSNAQTSPGQRVENHSNSYQAPHVENNSHSYAAPSVSAPAPHYSAPAPAPSAPASAPAASSHK